MKVARRLPSRPNANGLTPSLQTPRTKTFGKQLSGVMADVYHSSQLFSPTRALLWTNTPRQPHSGLVFRQLSKLKLARQHERVRICSCEPEPSRICKDDQQQRKGDFNTVVHPPWPAEMEGLTNEMNSNSSRDITSNDISAYFALAPNIH